MTRGKQSAVIVRMGLLRDIQLYMMDHLFDDKLQRLKVDQELRQIAQGNAALISANTNTFMFGSKWYPIDDPHPDSNRTLHENFRTRVDELVNGIDNKAREFKAGVAALISNVLSVARHTDDLYNIFPKELASALPIISSSIFNIGLPLTPEEVAEINVINIPNLSVFHRLLMNKLLCAQVKP